MKKGSKGTSKVTSKGTSKVTSKGTSKVTKVIEQKAAQTAHEYFLRRYDSIKTVVAFKESWANGTGYMDNLVASQQKESLFKFTDNMNRKGIYVVTPAGYAVAIFERYSGGEKGVLVTNSSKRVGLWLSAVSLPEIQLLFGEMDFKGMSAILTECADRFVYIPNRLAEVLTDICDLIKTRNA